MTLEPANLETADTPTFIATSLQKRAFSFPETFVGLHRSILSFLLLS